MSKIGLVVSKKELVGYDGVYEYRVQMPNRTLEFLNVKTSKIEVGNKVELEEIQEEKKYRIVRIV